MSTTGTYLAICYDGGDVQGDIPDRSFWRCFDSVWGASYFRRVKMRAVSVNYRD